MVNAATCVHIELNLSQERADTYINEFEVLVNAPQPVHVILVQLQLRRLHVLNDLFRNDSSRDDPHPPVQGKGNAYLKQRSIYTASMSGIQNLKIMVMHTVFS